jgi:hypothetical protein
MYKKCPMKKIEWSKYGYNFENMQKEVPHYKTEEYFPANVKFIEPPVENEGDIPEYKEEIFTTYPESHEDAH